MDDDLFDALIEGAPEPSAADELAQRGEAGPQNMEEAYRAYVRPVAESATAQWLGNAALSAIDGATFSARLPLTALATGENLEDVVADDMRRTDDNFWSSTAGMIAGSVASSYGLYKGGASALGAGTGLGAAAIQRAAEASAATRMLTASTIGAAEAGLHTLSRTGDAAKVGEAALWGAGAGALFQGVFELGSAVGKKALNWRNSSMSQKLAADEMLTDLQRRGIVKPDGSPIDERELTRRMLHRAAGKDVGDVMTPEGVDVDLLGLVPELGDYAKKMGYSQSPEDQIKFAKYYAARLASARHAQSRAVSEAVKQIHRTNPKHADLPTEKLTVGGVKQLANDLRKSLTPRYDAALKEADASGVSAGAGELFDALSAPGISLPKDRRAIVARTLTGNVSEDTAKIINAIFKPARKSKKPGAKPRAKLQRQGAALLNDVSMRELYNARLRLDTLIDKAKDGSGGWHKDSIAPLIEIRNRINALSHSVQNRYRFTDLIVLDQEFGGVSAMADAYEAGVHFAKTGRWEGRAFDRWSTNPGFEANIAQAALERGVADQIAEEIGSLRNTQQVINYMTNEPELAHRIKDMVGDEGYQRILATMVSADAAERAAAAVLPPGPTVANDSIVPTGGVRVAKDMLLGSGEARPGPAQAQAGVEMLQSSPMASNPNNILSLIQAMQQGGTAPLARPQVVGTGAAGASQAQNPDQTPAADRMFDALIEQ